LLVIAVGAVFHSPRVVTGQASQLSVELDVPEYLPDSEALRHHTKLFVATNW